MMRFNMLFNKLLFLLSHRSYSTPLVNPIMPMYYMGTITSSSNTNQCTAQDNVISNMSQSSGGHTQQTSYMAHQGKFIKYFCGFECLTYFSSSTILYVRIF